MVPVEPVDLMAHWVEQLVQRRERDPGLGLHTGGAQHPHPEIRGPCRGGVQERRLPRPGLAVEQQTRAAPAGSGEQGADQLQLGLTPQETGSARP